MPDETTKDQSTDESQYVEVSIPNFYVNRVRVQSSYLEIVMLLLEKLDQESMTIKARVVMAPAHAKLLAAALSAQVKNWEEKFGEIVLPPKSTPTEATAASSSEPAPQPEQSPNVAAE